MKVTNILTIPFAAALLLASSLVGAAPAESVNVNEVTSSMQAADTPSSLNALVNQVQPRKQGQCFSAKNCTGKVIGSHQHAHNCKNAGGKSWRSGVTGQCSNL